MLEEALKDGEKMHLDRAAREVSFSLARIYCSKWQQRSPNVFPLAGALLTDFASDPSASETDKEVAHRFCCREKLNTLHPHVASTKRNAADQNIVYENFVSEKSKL